MEFWNDLFTEKSFKILIKLNKELNFILIGGWAIYFYTKQIKSKDIDIIVSFNEFLKLNKDTLRKNEKLKKYEMKIDNVSIDIYVEHYSSFIIPIKEIKKNTIVIENFKLPKKEILLFLKIQAEIERKRSIKGLKDRVDIISLLMSKVDYKFLYELARKYKLKEYIEELLEIVEKSKEEFEYLEIKDYRKIKKIKTSLIKEIKDILKKLRKEKSK